MLHALMFYAYFLANTLILMPLNDNVLDAVELEGAVILQLSLTDDELVIHWADKSFKWDQQLVAYPF